MRWMRGAASGTGFRSHHSQFKLMFINPSKW